MLTEKTDAAAAPGTHHAPAPGSLDDLVCYFEGEWVAMRDAGVAYRDVNGQLNTVPGLTGTWYAVEPDPLDGSRVWAADSTTGQVVHVDTNGTLIQSLEGFSTSQKWLAVMLQGP